MLQNENNNRILETIVLGGGCFWCVEAAFQQKEGIEKVTSGYAGGKDPDPTYEKVSTGDTGHAEVVKIVYDPKKISIEEILDIFFAIHDPTTLDRQGADIGSQYRSAIFFQGEKQLAETEEYIKKLENENRFDGNILTQVVPLEKFFPAEDYHQNFFRKNPGHAYCQSVIKPKLTKLQNK